MKLRPSVVAGGLLILVSGLMLLFIFGMSTLSGGEFPEGGAEWWSAVLGTMFGPGDPGVFTYSLLALFALGVHLCFRTPGKRLTVRRMMAWVAAVALFLGVFMWAAMKEEVVMMSTVRRADGKMVETKQYANFFGPTKTVETIEP
jgi:hypothetical protein